MISRTVFKKNYIFFYLRKLSDNVTVVDVHPKNYIKILYWTQLSKNASLQFPNRKKV